MDESTPPTETATLLQQLRDDRGVSQKDFHGGFKEVTARDVRLAAPADGWDHSFGLMVRREWEGLERDRFEVAAAGLSRPVPPVVFQADPRSVLVDADEHLVRLASMKAPPKAHQPFHPAWRIWVRDEDAATVYADQNLLASAVATTPPKLRRKLPQAWADWLTEPPKDEAKLLKAAARGFLSLFYAGHYVYVVQRWGLPNRAAVARELAALVAARGI